MAYRRADDELFGKYCYIDTPWIAGKHTIYRIIRSGVRSNSWCEVPINGLTKKVNHGEHMEDIVLVVLDTLIDEDAEIIRVALKDIEIIEADRKTENSSEIPNNSKDEPQTDCDGCQHYADKHTADACYECKRSYTDGYVPQTDTEIAKEIVHTMIDDAVIAEDAYPDLRQKMHDAVDEYEPQTVERAKAEAVAMLLKSKDESRTDCPWK